MRKTRGTKRTRGQVVRGLHLLMFTIFSVSSWGKEILIRPEGVSRSLFEASVEANNQWETLAESYNRLRPQPIKKEHLLGLFKEARISSLENQQQGKAKFLQVVEEVLSDDWDEPSREVLFFSHLYLALHSVDSSEQTLWYKKSIPFYSSNVFTFFPKKVRREVDRLLGEAKKRQYIWMPYDQLSDYEWIILDGKAISNDFGREIPVLEGPHRVTLISNAYPKWTGVLRQEEFQTLYFKDKQPFVRGTCSDYEIHHLPEDRNNLLLFFDKSCVLKGEDLNKNWAIATQPIAYAETLRKDQIPSDNFFKNRIWNYAIVGALIFGVAFLHYQNSSQTATTTTTTIKR